MIRFPFFMIPSASSAEFWSGEKKKIYFLPESDWFLHVTGSYSLGFCCILLGISSSKALLTSLAFDSKSPCDLQQLELSTYHYFVYDKNSFIFLCFTSGNEHLNIVKNVSIVRGGISAAWIKMKYVCFLWIIKRLHLAQTYPNTGAFSHKIRHGC